MKSITRFTKNIKGRKCLNCENQISEEDNFCPKCGQVNDVKPISLKQYFSEYLAGFYSFDNRFIKTIIPLLFKPGSVTRKFVEGQRMRYVNPFQLYLHITILFFMMIGIFSTYDQFKPQSESLSSIIANTNDNNAIIAYDTIKNSALKKIQQIDSNNNALEPDSIKAQLDNISSAVQNSISEKDSIVTDKMSIRHFTDSLLNNTNYSELLTKNNFNNVQKDSIFDLLFKPIEIKISALSSNDSTKVITDLNQVIYQLGDINKDEELKKEAILSIEEFFDQQQIDYKVPSKHRDQLLQDKNKNSLTALFSKVGRFMEYDKAYPEANTFDALDELGYKKNYWNVFYYSKAQNLNKSISDPAFLKSYMERIISKVSVALFLLLPVFTFLVALLYFRSKYNYTEHLVFVFHVQTVFFLLLMFFMLIDRLFNTSSVETIFIILFLIYLYKALRNFYKQGRLKTIVKYFILNISFMILALIGGIIISFIAFMI